MAGTAPNFKLSRLLLGLGGSLLVAALFLVTGALIILGTRTGAYHNLQQSLERFVGN